MNWVNELTIQYKEGRKELRKKLNNLDLNTAEGKSDRKYINSMINEMSFVIDWLKIGKNPDQERGIHKNAVYQTAQIEDIDTLPDIYGDLRAERKKLRRMTEDEKQIVREVFFSMTDRQRECFIRHIGQLQTLQEIGEDMGLSRNTVYSHVNRAREKVAEILEKNGVG